MPTKIADGRFWARARVGGRQHSLGVYATLDEAAAVEGQYIRDNCETPAVDDRTVGGYGTKWLDTRGRAQEHDRNRWKTHIASSSLATLRLDRVTRADVRAWIDGVAAKRSSSKFKSKSKKTISTATAARALSLLSACFNSAVDAGLCEDNPCRRVKLKKVVEDEDKWSYLEPHEQRRLLTSDGILEADRMIIGFAIGTGMRQGELRKLLLADVHADEREPHVTLRKTKSGKNRTIPLFGIALISIRRWLQLLPGYCANNDRGLAFPTHEGGMRAPGHPLGLVTTPAGKRKDRWAVLQIAAGTRHVRWHDLRHTCASSLICGWWGRRWTLEEVRSLLGHLSVVTSARYAHLGETALKTAASVTHRAELWEVSDFTKTTVGQEGFEPSTDGLKGRSDTHTDSDTYDLSSLAHDSIALLTAQATGDPSAARLATDLASRILESTKTTAKRSA